MDTSGTIEDDDDSLPDHKIYRKSAIRFSLVQRFRAIISEEEKQQNRTNQNQKLPTYKQGSELMGAKIAQPDYADPQKLFGHLTNSQLSLNSTTSSPNSQTSNTNNNQSVEVISLNSSNSQKEEVITKNIFETIIDTGQKYLKIKSPLAEKKFHECDQKSSRKLVESHPNESVDYYESILEQSLQTNESQLKCNAQKPVINPKPVMKRPLKPPPPIPQKPNLKNLTNNSPSPNTKGWVKTVASRFE